MPHGTAVPLGALNGLGIGTRCFQDVLDGAPPWPVLRSRPYYHRKSDTRMIAEMDSHGQSLTMRRLLVLPSCISDDNT